MILTSYGLADCGCVRSQNEDRILFDDALGLYVVCDGMGGRRGGEIAAELAANAIQQYVDSSRDPKEVTWPYGYNLRMSFAGNRVLTAAKLANRQVWRRSEEALQYLGMGTTIAAVLVEPGSAAIATLATAVCTCGAAPVWSYSASTIPWWARRPLARQSPRST